jgi:hypothetical protein
MFVRGGESMHDGLALQRISRMKMMLLLGATIDSESQIINIRKGDSSSRSVSAAGSIRQDDHLMHLCPSPLSFLAGYRRYSGDHALTRRDTNKDVNYPLRETGNMTVSAQSGSTLERDLESDLRKDLKIKPSAYRSELTALTDAAGHKGKPSESVTKMVHTVRYARLTAAWKLGRNDEEVEVTGADLLNTATQIWAETPVFTSESAATRG